MAKKKQSIPQYATTVIKGVEYYRTRIEDADGKRVTLYARTSEELYSKVTRHERRIAMQNPQGKSHGSGVLRERLLMQSWQRFPLRH